MPYVYIYILYLYIYIYIYYLWKRLLVMLMKEAWAVIQSFFALIVDDDRTYHTYFCILFS